MSKPERKEWNKTNLASTLIGAAGVAVLIASGQIVLGSSAAAITYLFGGKLRKRHCEQPEGDE